MEEQLFKGEKHKKLPKLRLVLAQARWPYRDSILHCRFLLGWTDAPFLEHHQGSWCTEIKAVSRESRRWSAIGLSGIYRHFSTTHRQTDFIDSQWTLFIKHDDLACIYHEAITAVSFSEPPSSHIDNKRKKIFFFSCNGNSWDPCFSKVGIPLYVRDPKHLAGVWWLNTCGFLGTGHQEAEDLVWVGRGGYWFHRWVGAGEDFEEKPRGDWRGLHWGEVGGTGPFTSSPSLMVPEVGEERQHVSD